MFIFLIICAFCANKIKGKGVTAMAFLTCSYKSNIRGFNVNFNAIIPEDQHDDIPTLYLLHGLSDDHTAWCRYSAVERYARERGLAVIMPCVERSFYSDMKYGPKYYTFVSDELVKYTRQLFRLSDKREKTFVAGLSMGGYGSLKLGLSKPWQYAGVASLSGVTDIAARIEREREGWKHDATRIWGEDFVQTIKGSGDDIFALVDKLEKSGEPKPKIFQVCGTSDFLYEDNVKFNEFMKDKDFAYRYEEGEGAHTWDFWDRWLPVALDFLLEEK